MIRFFTASFPLFWHVFPMDYHGMHPIFWHNFRTMPSQFSNPHPSIFAQPPSQFLNTLWHNFRMAFQIYFSHSLLPTFLACISHGLPRHASHFLAQFSQSTSITNSSIFGTIFAKHIHYKFQHLWHNFRKAHPHHFPASLAQFSQSTSISSSSIFGTIFAQPPSHFSGMYFPWITTACISFSGTIFAPCHLNFQTRIPAFLHSLRPNF